LRRGDAHEKKFGQKIVMRFLQSRRYGAAGFNGGFSMSIEQTANRFAPIILSILRIALALVLLQHPLSKFMAFPLQMNAPAMFSLYWWAGVIETVFGVLLLLGLWTRLAAFILSGHMAFVYFIAHAPKTPYPLTNGGEIAVLFCFSLLYVAAVGGGPISVDALRGKK
jgi:putative oxidoreductase